MQKNDYQDTQSTTKTQNDRKDTHTYYAQLKMTKEYKYYIYIYKSDRVSPVIRSFGLRCVCVCRWEGLLFYC